MLIFTFALQAIAVLAGLASAFFWWRSSAHVAKVYFFDLPEKGIGKHAFTMSTEDGEHVVYDFMPGSKLSSWGAKCAALSILAQSIAVAVEALSGV